MIVENVFFIFIDLYGLESFVLGYIGLYLLGFILFWGLRRFFIFLGVYRLFVIKEEGSVVE